MIRAFPEWLDLRSSSPEKMLCLGGVSRNDLSKKGQIPWNKKIPDPEFMADTLKVFEGNKGQDP